MTTKEQIIAVAEWQGWKPETRKMYAGQKNVKGWGFNTHLSMGHRDRQFVTRSDQFPDWANDLHAIMDVVAVLTDQQHPDYINAMCDELGFDGLRLWDDSHAFFAINASAPQRLEALCRTLWPERWKE